MVQGNLKWQLCLFFTASYLDGFLIFSTQGSLVQGNLTAIMFLFLHNVVFGRLSLLRAVWYKVNKAPGFGSYTPRPFLPSHLVCTVGGHVVVGDCYLKKASEVNMCETKRTKRTYKTKQYKRIKIHISTIHSIKYF